PIPDLRPLRRVPHEASELGHRLRFEERLERLVVAEGLARNGRTLEDSPKLLRVILQRCSRQEPDATVPLANRLVQTPSPYRPLARTVLDLLCLVVHHDQILRGLL